MKVTVHGPASGYGPDGTLTSWAPDQPVEVDDGDKKAVTWARMFIRTGAATLVEDVKTKPAEPPKTAAKTETKTPARQPSTGGRA